MREPAGGDNAVLASTFATIDKKGAEVRPGGVLTAPGSEYLKRLSRWDLSRHDFGPMKASSNTTLSGRATEMLLAPL